MQDIQPPKGVIVHRLRTTGLGSGSETNTCRESCRVRRSCFGQGWSQIYDSGCHYRYKRSNCRQTQQEVIKAFVESIVTTFRAVQLQDSINREELLPFRVPVLFRALPVSLSSVASWEACRRRARGVKHWIISYCELQGQSSPGWLLGNTVTSPPPLNMCLLLVPFWHISLSFVLN